MLRYAENTTGTEPWSSNIRISAPRTVHVLSSLKGDTDYVVQVRAVNGIGTGPNFDADDSIDETQDVRGATGGIPSAPRNVRAVPTKDGNGSQLTISWSKVTASNGGGVLDGYTVETRAATAGADWVSAATELAASCDDPATTADTEACNINTTSVTVTVNDQVPENVGTTYVVRVRATTASSVTGSSGYSAPVKTAAVPTEPAALTARFDAATRSFIVEWTGLTGETAKTVSSYKVRWYPSVAGAPGSIGSATVSDNTAGSYTTKALTPGSYIVAVTAVNAIGNSMEAVLEDAVEVTPPPRQ